MATDGMERIIDADGHIFEDIDSIVSHLPTWWGERTNGNFGPFPELDHIHHHLHTVPPEAFNDPHGVAGWSGFMSDVGIDSAVLYPTRALSYGRIMDLDFADGVSYAYNNWIHQAYMAKDDRLQAVGLIPMQDPERAVKELRRIVTELGMCGAMLPSTGLKTHLGAKDYWPVYEEADRLGCALAVHGGAHSGLGLDTFNVFAAVHAMGHPSGIMLGFVSMLFNGVFDKFPNARFGFLEGGIGWMLMARERSESSYRAFEAVDPHGQLLRLEQGESVADYIKRQIDAGRIFVGVEGDEPDLAYAVSVFGNKPFMFSTDFPHEVNTEISKHEVREILDNPDLSQDDKTAIMFKNAERFYNLSPVGAST